MGIEVDGANQKLILDSDGDTYIEGATDDTLKVYVSGAQDFTITANTLTAESGSTIAAQALTATTVTASGIVKTDDATEATSTTDGSLQTDGGLSVVKDAVLGDDLKLLSDSSVIHFGTNSEVTLTHSHDAGLNLKHTATADDKPVVLTLQTGETDMAADDVIGKIAFQAPDEGTGTDAILVSAAIQAVAEGDHSSSSNATRLEFMTGASEAATSKMSLSSAALLTLTDASPKLKILPTTNGNDGVLEICGRSSDGSPTENRTQIKGEAEGSTANTKMTFHTENASGVNERLKIDSSGDLIQGTDSTGSNGRNFRFESSVHSYRAGTADAYHYVFFNANGEIGRIRTDGSSTAYNTSSDYRLKENQVAISNGITRLKQLKPYRFNFKADADTTVDGFFAHEVTPVVPEAIDGDKDAVDENGDIKPQAIDQSKLVPLLTSALQEAITKIETLETKVAALEG